MRGKENTANVAARKPRARAPLEAQGGAVGQDGGLEDQDIADLAGLVARCSLGGDPYAGSRRFHAQRAEPRRCACGAAATADDLLDARSYCEACWARSSAEWAAEGWACGSFAGRRGGAVTPAGPKKRVFFDDSDEDGGCEADCGRWGDLLGSGGFGFVAATAPDRVLKVFFDAAACAEEAEVYAALRALEGVGPRVGYVGDILDDRGRRWPSIELERLEPAWGRAPPQVVPGLLAAVAAVHRAGWVHGDLKPAHVCLRGDEVVLIDWGFGQAIGEAERPPAQTCGTFCYMAPELLLHEYWGRPVDLWALGCTVFELWAEEPLFSGEDAEQVLGEVVGCWGPLPAALGVVAADLGIRRSKPRASWDRIPPAVADLLGGLMQYQPWDRLPAEAALKLAGAVAVA